MKSHKKIGALIGALALAGSLGFGSAAAHAAITLDTTVDATVAGPRIDATIAGCTTDVGGVDLYVELYSYESDSVEVYGGYAATAGAIDATIYAPLPGKYSLGVWCLDYTGSALAESYSDVTVNQGYLDLAGPGGADTWMTDDLVTITSPVIGAGDTAIHSFDPNSSVKLRVIGPEGEVFDLGTAQADALGDLLAERVLPFTIDGIYTVEATGYRTVAGAVVETKAVILISQYQRYQPPVDPSDPIAEPPAAPPVDKGTGDKPTALPRTGSEGTGLISAAALISVAAGAAAVALRSRKN